MKIEMLRTVTMIVGLTAIIALAFFVDMGNMVGIKVCAILIPASMAAAVVLGQIEHVQREKAN